MSEVLVAPSLLPLVSIFGGCFTAPSFVTFQHILAGWILCLERHTVTGVLRAWGAVGSEQHPALQRFFRMAPWDLDSLSLCLIKLVLALLPQDQPIIVPV